MSVDRDRVTALAELGRKVALGGMEVDDFYEAHSALFQGGLWAIGRLLEALDTIDRARELHQAETKRPTFWPDDYCPCVHCGKPWPCPTRQALNGGNE